MTPAEILEKAADVIDKRGHCKGMLVNNKQQVCAVGAMLVALTGSALGCGIPQIWACAGGKEACDALETAIGVGDFGFWNDHPNRTAAEVTSTMRATAAVLRAQEAKSAVTPKTVTA